VAAIKVVHVQSGGSGYESRPRTEGGGGGYGIVKAVQDVRKELAQVLVPAVVLAIAVD